MIASNFHLAQLNIARMRAPLEDPIMAGFVAQLDYINSVADRAPGFVWRLQSEEGDATSIRAFADERIIVNMSVWESIEALHDYVYRSDHVGPFRDRGKWFERMEGQHMVLWWIRSRHVPTAEEGKARLQYLQENSPTARAFTFKKWFPPPGGPDRATSNFDYTGCDWAT